jgi:hypothetical protein
VTSNHLMDHTPYVIGMCSDCRREMWTGTDHPPGLKVSPDPRYCATCHHWRRAHPGADPRYVRNTRAEQIPAEWGEDDPTWRRRGNCAGSDEPEIFDRLPDEDEREPGWSLEVALKTAQVAADAYCSFCPVLLVCRAKAEHHGYEGVWGGAFFERDEWRDLLVPGVTGRTIHHPKHPRAGRGHTVVVDTAPEEIAAA